MNYFVGQEVTKRVVGSGLGVDIFINLFISIQMLLKLVLLILNYIITIVWLFIIFQRFKFKSQITSV